MLDRFSAHLASFLNERRRHTYPWFVLAVTWIVALLNAVFARGWRGAFGQVLGIDFLIFYTSGLLYRTRAMSLYDFPTQLILERDLIAPTQLPGSGPFSNPPFAAWAYSLLAEVPLIPAAISWTMGSLICASASAALLARYVAPSRSWSSTGRLALMVFSSFPFVSGLQAGQNHALSLLLITLISILILRGRWLPAGLGCGLLLYKPQFVLGFVLLFVVWRRWKALVGLCMVALAWCMPVVIQHGLAPFREFSRFSPALLLLPWSPGWPAEQLVTPYGLMASLLPRQAQPVIFSISLLFAALAAGATLRVAFAAREGGAKEVAYSIAAAILFPLLATPYALLYDLLPLVTLFALLWPHASAVGDSLRLLVSAAFGYAASLFLPSLSALVHVALMAFVPLLLLWIYRLPGPRLMSADVIVGKR